jgi:Cu(I)/Ag(I) efflux system membrane fusion protein
MKNKSLILALILVVVMGAGGYGLYRLGMNHAMRMNGMTSDAASAGPAAAGAQKPGDSDPTTGKKVLYWHDPMVPGQKFDKPGKSPFMDMQLVPVYADGGAAEGAVAISPRVQQNLGVRTAEVKSGSLTSTVVAVGSVA